MKIIALSFLNICFLCCLSCGSSPESSPSTQEHHGHQKHQKHGHGHANHHMNEMPFEKLVERFESDERVADQKPEAVLNFLGDLQGQKIIDIGAGTGFFSFRLVEAGAQVIAADVDERFQQYIQEKKAKLGLSDDQLSLRKLPYDSPSLSKGEVDRAIIVNTYHHIENRKEYFAQVKNGLKENGSLVVIDFFKKESPVGPPIEMKMAIGQVKSELQSAGFTDFVENNDLLPYQYILIAK